MTRVNKLKIYILCVFAVNFIAYIVYISVCNTTSTKIQFYTDTRNVPSSIQTRSLPGGKPRKNIFFLKTHKTASSTIQNILMRFGLRHSLNFMLPKADNYLGYLSPITFDNIHNQSIPTDKKFNIFTHHSRYRRHTNQFLYPDTIRVTILRNPSEHFESVFNFYNLPKVFKVSSFRQLVESLPQNNSYLISSKRKIQGRNQMSRDLGLEISQYQNETEISNFIRYIDEEFDLVMIREHMEASLVLLAHLMGWPLHYVSYIPLMKRTTNKSELSERDRRNLLQFNHADHLLYEYFLEKFRKRVLEYGFEKLVADVQILHSINVEMRKRCILKESDHGFYHTISYELKDQADWECVHITKMELPFTSEIREEQIARLELIHRLEDLIETRSRER